MKSEPSGRWWDDENFQNGLVALLVNDYKTLCECAPLLGPNDFKPAKGARDGRARWIVAERALNYFSKHRGPIGALLRADVLQHASVMGFGAAQLAELKEYLKKLEAVEILSPAALTEKVVAFKSQNLKATAISELIDLQSAGLLTDEKWQEISRTALSASYRATETVDYMATFDVRAGRRAENQRRARVPWTFIEPLDNLVRCVGPKQLGMVLAPYKRGKSAFLLWMTAALALQKLRVLYITLEDPIDTVEDRLDSIITHVPLKQLADYPKRTRRKFEQRRGTTGMSKGGIEIFDGTEGGVSVMLIEKLIEEMREEGTPAHAVIVDYDEEVEPSKKFNEKRFETDDVYRGMRRAAAKHNVIWWTAAQTQRDTRHLRILSGDKVAEDIGKMRKVTCGLSLGKGEWSNDGFYLWVAAHKSDRMEVGCELVPDMSRMLVYDREATRRAEKEHAV